MTDQVFTPGTKTWGDVSFSDVFPERRKNRIIGLSFPEQNGSLGLEPSVLSVLPQGDRSEFSPRNIRFNDGDVEMYLCSVYISGMDEFREWSATQDRRKIIVGGYHPTSFPEEFQNFATKIVQGPCDDIFATVDQSGQVVPGRLSFKHPPRYDLYDVRMNQQVIPGKMKDDICTSIWTSQGCPMRCDFCCTPIMAPKLVSKPIELVRAEVEILKSRQPKWLFIRDENFPLQKDWKERLRLISTTGAQIYLFASANLLKEEHIAFMKSQNVYMICLGLEDINVQYDKNKQLDRVVELLKKHGVATYLSFIVDPLQIIGREAGADFYDRLKKRFYELGPEMVCGNFLMPFRGTKIWDKYYAHVGPEDYKHYDSKTAFLVRNPVVRAKMQFFMFWHQWQYYNSDFYNRHVRKFAVNDTLHQRFTELFDKFRPVYEAEWDRRA